MPTKVVRTLFQLSLDFDLDFDHLFQLHVWLWEEFLNLTHGKTAIHSEGCQLQTSIGSLKLNSARLTISSLFTSKVGEENAIMCALYSLLHTKKFHILIYKAASSLVTAISGTICLTTCKSNRLHRSWKRGMTSMSLGKTVSRSKIKPAIQNFITVCQPYCSYPLNPHRLVFPCLWQMCLSAFSIAKMFADSLIKTEVSRKEQKI